MLISAESTDGHAWQMPACAPAAGGPVLYWIPALGVPAGKYATWTRALQAHGIGTVVHEWRGIGSSNWRAGRGTDWSYRILLEDVATGIARAREELPAGRWWYGGHSLGGQFAALGSILAPADGLVLVATGVPHHRCFPWPRRWLVRGFARLLRPITALAGHFPGDWLNWAGREAAGVMCDWATTVRSGRYDGLGLPTDPERELARLEQPVLAITFEDDWLAPAKSMQALLAKLGTGPKRREHFDTERLGATADHFRWMREPAAVADRVNAWVGTQSR